MSEDARYRKHNDRSHGSSTYHKKDGTPVRAILKREAQQEIEEEIREGGPMEMIEATENEDGTFDIVGESEKGERYVFKGCYLSGIDLVDGGSTGPEDVGVSFEFQDGDAQILEDLKADISTVSTWDPPKEKEPIESTKPDTITKHFLDWSRYCRLKVPGVPPGTLARVDDDDPSQAR